MKSEKRSKHLLRDPLPKFIFWDTSFAVSAILEPSGSSKHNAIVGFLDRLIQEKTCVVFSTHLFYEFHWACLKNEAIKCYGSKEKADKAVDKNFQEVSLKCLKKVVKNTKALQELLSKLYKVIRINFDEPDMVREAMILGHRYNIDMGDLIHLGTMLFAKEENIVSFDSHFHIPIVNVWCRYYS